MVGPCAPGGILKGESLAWCPERTSRPLLTCGVVSAADVGAALDALGAAVVVCPLLSLMGLILLLLL